MAFSIGIAVVATLIYRSVTPNLPPSHQPKSAADVEALYDSKIRPVISEAAAKNAAAISRAEDEINQMFARYGQGVPKFTEDITSWGTRFGILGRTGSDFWNNYKTDTTKRDTVGAYVTEKFETHILSEKQLTSDLERVLEQFQSDMEATWNVMLSQIGTVCTEAELDTSVVNSLKGGIFTEHVNTLTATMPQQSLGGALVATVAVGAAEVVVRKLVQRLITQAGIRVAGMAAGAGIAALGVAGTGAAAGAGGGTALLPGPGTLIGAGVGFAVGALVDSWASKKLEEKLAAQCNSFLAETKTSILQGNAEHPSLMTSMDDSVELFTQATERSIKHSLAFIR